MPSKPNTPIEALKHSDTRVNIPTEELREFVAEDEKAPRAILYPRDTSLDPQLVWKGKDEQDREGLTVPAVPIYIQEKIQPRAIIEDLRARAREEQPALQPDLFSDFNGIEWEDLVDFYQHEQHWSNRLILGDSLLVMNSLAEKEGLKGRVQMIYMDPPYGIKFGSNWQVSTRKRDVTDGSAPDMTRQPEQIRAFRDTWQLGIHSYLAYLRDRLVVARELLTESGSIFVQIGDENVHLVRCLLDEVFGSENFVVTINLKKKGNQKGGSIESITDYIILYAKQKPSMKFRPLYLRRIESGAGFVSDQLTSGGLRKNQNYDYATQGRVFRPASGNCWKIVEAGMNRVRQAERLVVGKGQIRFRKLDSDFGYTALTNNWEDTGGPGEVVYVVQTAAKVIQRCILMTTDPGDLVLDPTCGSGTTAFVAEQWGRRWITTDTSRVALALARTRLMAGRFPYYLLADTPEGLLKEAQVEGRAPAVPAPKTSGDIKRGFVYKKVPHITLKSIANNEEIDVIHARYEEELEPVRAELNRLLKKEWEEWEVPREADGAWPSEAGDLLTQWWKLRRQRQEEMDASIARRADTEVLYDQPYEDPKRIRVAGPFTVEGLSPHRMLDVAEKSALAKGNSEAHPGLSITVRGPDDFGRTIIENLKKAGVQNTKQGERLKFDTLEVYPGDWIQAAGEYRNSAGKVQRVAVTLGPEFGTVGPELVREAAKAALKGAGFDVLVICGFAFDAHAGETAKEFSPEPTPAAPAGQDDGNGAGGYAVAEEVRQYGKLRVLLARMNPDLAMGDELLKKTGAGNLFTIFGEPDLLVERTDDGKVVVEIRGVDVFDPTTGEVRSSNTDDIACWFIDTDYNGESFFVRHAYFTGADEPYEKLKRALRAEIDEAAWETLYSTRSRPFTPPTSGKIAIKVINHYGDEVLKVFTVA